MKSGSISGSRPPWLEPAAIATLPGWAAAAVPGRATGGLDLALFSGGDERVFLDPATGRSQYGTPRGCAADEIWFSSSTASAMSGRAYDAAAAAWESLVRGTQTVEDGFESIRRRLTRIFGTDGTQAILAGSGTETVLICLALARMLCGARITIIIVGCAETGRGVSSAAAGLHFSRHAAFAEVVPGDRLDGFQDLDINVDTIAIRDRAGGLRSTAEVDAELAQKVAAARRAGHDVIIHRLEASKTGHCAPSLAALEALHAAAPDHIFIFADACQLRCSATHIQSLLERGFLVAITGSKFAGGPPFAGALLVPPSIMQRLRPLPLPAGLAAYSAQLDWPPILRRMLSPGFLPMANIGLALRWQAALAEIERFCACSPDLRDAIFARFHDGVSRRCAETAGFDLLPGPAKRAESWGDTILCVAMRHADGRFYDMAEATAVQRRLREGCMAGMTGAAKRFHLGQPVAVAGAGVLRVCAGAVLINRVAEAIASGVSLAAAFAPVAADLDDLFVAWRAAMEISTADRAETAAL